MSLQCMCCLGVVFRFGVPLWAVVTSRRHAGLWRCAAISESFSEPSQCHGVVMATHYHLRDLLVFLPCGDLILWTDTGVCVPLSQRPFLVTEIFSGPLRLVFRVATHAVVCRTFPWLHQTSSKSASGTFPGLVGSWAGRIFGWID